jgi:hypothetical protein
LAFTHEETALEAARYSGASDMIAGRMPSLVKGAGFAKIGGNQPLTDDAEIFKRSMDAEKSLRSAVKTAIASPDSVRKSINPAFSSQFGLFLSENTAPGLGNVVNEIQSVLSAELGKNITLTSPLSSGFVPYDLVAPSRLIYPIYSPLRNKVPRVPGQGTSHRAKLVTGITGSQTGGQGAQRVSISEVPSGQSIGGNWPLSIPASGSQTATDMNIPYSFFGLSESLSWLAQFAGQGFEDVSALANLVLLQEFMLAEEYSMLSGTKTALTTPSAPTLSARSAGTGETALSGITTNLYVKVSALNYFGETLASTAANVAPSAGQVVDVTISPVRGAFVYNIYVSTGTSAGTYYLMATKVGATRYTLQGAIPTTGTTPPTADTGTASSNDYEGWLSIVDGHASVDSSVYPSGFTGSYINKSANTTLNHEILFSAFEAMWDGATATGNTAASGATGFRADPAEIVAEGSDIARLADEVIASGSNTNYRLMLMQDDVGGVRSGAAVSEIQNPITRSLVRIVVHPFLYQGTAFLNSYTLPMSWSNVSNVWENVMVQDYLSINWPVIDASFRYSIYMYGALVCYAPQYNGVIQGLQQSSTTPYN